MSNLPLISAPEAFELICSPQNEFVAIDVRSSGEYRGGHFSGTLNLPILNDQHRHEVGLTYKQKGSEQARILGHELVSGDYREKMISSWCQEIEKSSGAAMVFCWRGGLRSQIAQQWITEQGKEILRIEGGYKSLRKLALESVEKKRNYVVLSGPTGSGKTEFLKKIPNSVDLEGLANHRGSVFGLRMKQTQPTQAHFENDLGQALYLQKDFILLEDESRLIGHRYLCNDIYDQMTCAPTVSLIVDKQTRAKNIYDEYVLEPQTDGYNLVEIHAYYSDCIQRIQKTLGGLQAQQCLKKMKEAFDTNELSAHLEWIEFLLKSYYDKLYAFSLAKKNRKVLHEGDTQSSLEFLQHYREKKT